MICKICGAENKDSAKFCSSCGNRIEIPQPETNLDPVPEHNYCSRCGTDNDPVASFCMSCGARLRSSDSQEDYYGSSQEDHYGSQHDDYSGSSSQEDYYESSQNDYYGSGSQEDYYGSFQEDYREPHQEQYYYGSQTQNQYGGPQQDQYYQQPVPPVKSKVAAGVLGILLGGLGIHKFYLGYTKEGLIMLLVSVLTFGIGGVVMGIIGLVEGIVYLTCSDMAFYDTYVYGHKGWF